MYWKAQNLPFWKAQNHRLSKMLFFVKTSYTYDRLLEGLIPCKVILFQDKYYREDHTSCKSGIQWGKKVYKLLWQLVHNIWGSRNQQLHETNRIAKLQGLPQVQEAIRSEYALGLHQLLACEFSIYFSTWLEILLKRPLLTLKHWLLTIWLGRNMFGRSEDIVDGFSCDGPLRSWLGLPKLST